MPTFTTNDGVSLEYRDTGGPGTPLVMVHGWAQTQAMFKYQLSGLSSSRRVITYDQRGHGLSDKPHYGYRIARLAHDFLELLDHLGLGQVDALGWSMGVSVIWSYIDNHGAGRLHQFVAVDQPSAVAAVPWMSTTEQNESGAIFDVRMLLELAGNLYGPEGERTRNDFVRNMFSGEPAPDVWEFVAEEIKSSPAYAIVPLILDHSIQDWRDVLPRIDIPTLVIGGEGSHVSPSSQRYISQRMPNSELHIFPTSEASSHFSFLENPAAFNTVVERFLNEQ